MKINRALVTGGAGFVGSHVVDALIERGVEVRIIDNLSTGRMENLNKEVIAFTERDISLVPECLPEIVDGCNAVFHFAANADVRGGATDSKIDFTQNTVVTRYVLECASKMNVKHFVFASSATVYGEAEERPTPETYCGRQTSHYGASKLSCEAMVEAYCNYVGMTGTILRFPSILGERYTHGIVFDVMRKLKNNCRELELFGDGFQQKSFIYVGDVVSGIMRAIEHNGDKCETFNVGSNELKHVYEIVAIIKEELELAHAKCIWQKQTRGWIGDSPVVLLNSSKLESLGWIARTSIKESVIKTVNWLLMNPEIFHDKTTH